MAQVGFAAGYLPLPQDVRVIEFLRLHGGCRACASGRAAPATGCEPFGIEHLARAMGTELSSGQKTLVGIVKAAMHRPRLLVLDEPTASLDPDVALRVRTGCASSATTRDRVAGHQPQHGRGRAAVRAGGLPVHGTWSPTDRAEITERFGRSTSRTCSCTWPTPQGPTMEDAV
jgi:hypothetical protein